LRAFSSGATAMTGIEAISNTVPAFREPPSRNARTVLTAMVCLLVAMFAALVVLMHLEGIVPGPGQTALSQLAHQHVGTGAAYAYAQGATAAVLLLLVIDHSIQVDVFAERFAFQRNAELEFERNRERYAFLRWGQTAFDNFSVVPPNTRICHQVNLEYLARGVQRPRRPGVPGHAGRDRLAHDDDQRPRGPGLGRRRH
jgi:hypothetical protein